MLQPNAMKAKLKIVDKMDTFKLFYQSKLEANWHSKAPDQFKVKNVIIS